MSASLKRYEGSIELGCGFGTNITDLDPQSLSELVQQVLAILLSIGQKIRNYLGETQVQLPSPPLTKILNQKPIRGINICLQQYCFFYVVHTLVNILFHKWEDKKAGGQV